MNARERAMARKQLDNRLSPLRDIPLARPPRGWVKAIRESLGMTTRQLAARLGVSQPRVVEIERNEVAGALTLESLERTARAMDCRLVYSLVPRKPLEKMSYDQALEVANAQVKSAAHSMALEDQAVDAKDQQHQLENLARSLQGSSKIWDEV